MKNIRTRFAPSPTGFLHLGGARTALFNYLFAKNQNGKFVLRIEDTDIERSKPEYEKDIIESLKWLGVRWDEGPDVGGAFAPYRQSEKTEVYKKYLEKLLKENKAYFCFCTPEELEVHRQYQMAAGRPPRYSGKCANLSGEEIKKNIKEGKKCVIRVRVPSKKIKINDIIKGEVEFDTEAIGDFVIAKSLTLPLFHFSVVIDDYEMKISHIIRGEEHLSNTPKHIILQELLDLPTPQYGHLALILAPDRSKLSKRHGSVPLQEYKKQGYLAESLINMIAFLGWNPGTDKEIYSLEELIKDFSIEKIQKSGAIFDVKKLDYLNGFYIRHKTSDEITKLCIPFLTSANLMSEDGKGYKVADTGEKIDFEQIKKIVLLYQERLKKLSEIVELSDFFFKEKIQYDKELLKWKGIGDRDLKDIIDKLTEILSKIKEEDWKIKKLENSLMPEAEKIGLEKTGKNDRGYLLWPFRAALTGKKFSAGPFEIAEVLGKEKVLQRLAAAREMLE